MTEAVGTARRAEIARVQNKVIHHFHLKISNVDVSLTKHVGLPGIDIPGMDGRHRCCVQILCPASGDPAKHNYFP